MNQAKALPQYEKIILEDAIKLLKEWEPAKAVSLAIQHCFGGRINFEESRVYFSKVIGRVNKEFNLQKSLKDSGQSLNRRTIPIEKSSAMPRFR
ncbi:MAG: hypothetical protein MUF50_03850 [Planctomycetes bacterium]|jgi:hypothetical protein|nr:hypothetical protein [Planctomycetota bacterium]